MRFKGMLLFLILRVFWNLGVGILDFRERDDRDNFKTLVFYDSYGYNLRDAVNNLRLAHMNSEQQVQFFKSLQKGNIQEVKVIQDNGEVKMFIAANPQYKTLDIYDSNMKPISREQNAAMNALPENTLHQKHVTTITGVDKNNLDDLAKSKVIRKDLTEKKDDGTQLNNSKKNERLEEKHEAKHDSKISKKNSKKINDDSLMPKKRVSDKKGLRI